VLDSPVVTTFRPRISGVSLLAAAVVVLLPALAWLQYSWLEQIADADRERRARTLRTAASQLAQDFDGEVGKAAFALQIDPAMVESDSWTGFADKYQVWADGALAPGMVKAIYFVDAPDQGVQLKDGEAPRLRVWNAQTGTFDDSTWPDELTLVRTRFTHDNPTVVDLQLGMVARGPGERGVPGERRGIQRMLFPPTPAGDSQTIVVPVVRVTPGKPTGAMSPEPPDVRLLGYTIVRLDLAALGTQVLPTLVRRHLYDNAGNTDFVIAVVSRDSASQVIFESEPRAAVTASATPDETVSLLGPRLGPFVFMSRGSEVRGGNRMSVTREGQVTYPPPPLPPPSAQAVAKDNRVVSVIEARRTENVVTMQRPVGNDGHWRLVAKHRAGSLEAAVAAARTRNFALSSGILALLGAAIGLIVVSARRADRLARQQLEFVAAVSHELRTPVSVIGAAAGNLADGVVGEPDRVKRYGATIQNEARRLAETVERVLQLAGIAAGRAAASPTLVPGHQLIHDAIAAIRHEAESAGVTIERHIPDALPSVQGDAMALRSALQNLIGNAVKYGGEARWVRIGAQATGRALRIVVEDRGFGIDAIDRKHIFEPFYRGREAQSRQIQGSGLGLHLVRRIIEAHGGTVSVQSDPGKGSTFTVELPIAPATESGAPAQSPVEAGL
jgi:signal transduction histidine kinase